MKKGTNLARKGFTLIELMVVVVIIGLLATFVVPKIMDKPDQARVEKAKMEINLLAQAFRMYKLDNGAYPSVEQGLEALVKEPSGEPQPMSWKPGGYIEGDIPKDPWGSPYIYRSTDDGSFSITSYGSDRKEGGTGYAADIRG